MKRSLLLATLLLVLPASGQEPDPVQAALADLKDGKPNQAELQRAVPLLADPAGRNTIRTAILTIDPFPSALMVT